MAAFDAVALEARLEAKLKLGNGSSSGKGSIPLPGQALVLSMGPPPVRHLKTCFGASFSFTYVSPGVCAWGGD